jgi:hypothetical protein
MGGSGFLGLAQPSRASGSYALPRLLAESRLPPPCPLRSLTGLRSSRKPQKSGHVCRRVGFSSSPGLLRNRASIMSAVSAWPRFLRAPFI